MAFKDSLEKLRALPDKQKKIVLWTIVAVLGIIMGFFWINSVGKTFSKISESAKSVKFPEVNVQIPQLNISPATSSSNK
jgi:phage protein U